MTRIRLNRKLIDIVPTSHARVFASPVETHNESILSTIAIDPALLAPVPPSPLPPDGVLLKSAVGVVIALSLDTPYVDADDFDKVTFWCKQPGTDVSKQLHFVDFAGDHASHFPIEFELPADAHDAEGLYRLFFTVEFAGGGAGTSTDTPLTVDLTPPGEGLDLAHLEFDPDDDIETKGIRAEILKDDGAGGKYVSAYIPSYGRGAGSGVMTAPGDTYELFESAASVSTGPVTIVGGHAEIRITEAELTAIGNKPDASFTYTLTDRAGNVSDPESKPIVVAIDLTSLTLAEAAVPAYDDDLGTKVITLTEALGTDNKGFIVDVPWDAEMVPVTDQIVLTLNDIPAGPVPVGPVNTAMEIFMPYKVSYAVWLTGAGDGTVDLPLPAAVAYQLVRNGITIGTAPDHDVAINFFHNVTDPDPETPENEALRLAVVVSASGERDEIPLDDVGQAGTIEIVPLAEGSATESAIVAGDTIIVHYDTQTLTPPFPVPSIADPNIPLVIPLPGPVTENGPSGEVLVWYEVVHPLSDGEHDNVSISFPKTVIVEGTTGQPGDGALVEGTFPEADERGLIGKPILQDGTQFVIEPYANRDDTDAIVLTIDFFQDLSHPTAGLETVPLPARKIMLTTDGTLDADSGTIIIQIGPALVLGPWPVGETYRMHGHARYTITKSSGDPIADRPVTSAEALVGIDGR